MTVPQFLAALSIVGVCMVATASNFVLSLMIGFILAIIVICYIAYLGA